MSSWNGLRSVEFGPGMPVVVVPEKIVVEVELSTATPEFDVSW